MRIYIYVYIFVCVCVCVCINCLIALVRTSRTLMSRSGESSHPGLIPDLLGKAVNVSPLNIMLAVVLSDIFVVLEGQLCWVKYSWSSLSFSTLNTSSCSLLLCKVSA